MSFCPKCGANNPEGARFCGVCGEQLRVVGARPTSPVSVPSQVPPTISMGGGDQNGRRPKTKAHRARNLVLVVAALVLVAVIAVLLVLLLRRPSDLIPIERTDDVALFCDGAQLEEGKDGKLLFRARVPKDATSAQVQDEEGNVVAIIDLSDTTDDGDGFRVAETEVNVDAQEPGYLSYVLVVDTADDDGEETDDGASRSEPAIVPIVPESVNPVPATQDWLLARACDWVEQTYDHLEGRQEQAAQELAAHLLGLSDVSDAVAYGTTVVFSSDDGALYCVSLESVAKGMLGSADDHAVAYDGPAIAAYKRSEGDEDPLPVGLGITAGNTVTSGDVLVLEPTPSLMDSDAYELSTRACEAYASAQGCAMEQVSGDEALSTVLGGGLYGQGVVVLRAHGIEADGAGTSLLQMSVAGKEEDSSWDEVHGEVVSVVDKMRQSSPVDVGSLFFGMPDAPKAWRALVYARTTGDRASWDVGVAGTPYLVSWSNAAKPLENSIVWLASCGSLASESFASWAMGHGAQLVVGYEGPVEEERDAQALDILLGGLASDTDTWRGPNALELSDRVVNGAMLVGKKNGGTRVVGNQAFFAMGEGSIAGQVVDEDDTPMEDVRLQAYRFFHNGFEPLDKTRTGKDGRFKLTDLPCGRYVVRTTAGSDETIWTVVLDDQHVDGLTVHMSVSEESGEPQPEPEPEDEPSIEQGGLNQYSITDGSYLYCGLLVDPMDMAHGTPAVVRAPLSSPHDYSTVWQADFEGEQPMLSLCNGRLIVSVMRTNQGYSDRCLAFSMSTDGTNVHELALQNEDAPYASKICGYDGRLYYVSSAAGSWQVRSCLLDGTDDKITCEGNGLYRGATLNILGVADGMLCLEKREEQSEVFIASLRGDGTSSDPKLVLGDGERAAMVRGGLVRCEGMDLVRYDYDGSSRKVVTSFGTGPSIYLYNATSEVAIVAAYENMQEGFSVWRVDMATGNKGKFMKYALEAGAMEICGNKAVLCLFDDYEVYDLDAIVEDEAVPAEEAEPEPEPEPAASVPAGYFVLTGLVHAHYEDWGSGRGNVLSITLDEDVPYTWDYKGEQYDDHAHEVLITYEGQDDYGRWSAYDGKHMTIASEGLWAAYHDTGVMGVDSVATGEIMVV